MSFLAKNLRFLREKDGMTQEEFAKKFGCSRSNVASYERGTEPALSLLLDIVNYFDTTVENIYNVDLELDIPEDKKSENATTPGEVPPGYVVVDAVKYARMLEELLDRKERESREQKQRLSNQDK